jgi:Mitochondrial carrier protein
MSADFVAGFLSGSLGIAVGNPLDIIKVRLQAGHSGVGLSSASGVASNPTTLLRGTLDLCNTFVTTSDALLVCRCGSSDIGIRSTQRPTICYVQSFLEAAGAVYLRSHQTRRGRPLEDLACRCFGRSGKLGSFGAIRTNQMPCTALCWRSNFLPFCCEDCLED